MKKFLLIVLILPVWGGCSKFSVSHIKDLSYSGCASSTDTRAAEDGEIESLLTLKYEDGNLRVTCTNTLVNCSFKDFGLVCNVSIEGNVIHYTVEAKPSPDGNETDCLCLIETVSSLITGLETGKEYSFNYAPSQGLPSITFVFEKGLFLIQGR
ncbi:MAG: hypothetical protein IKW89_13070 [Bacteroidales bacterium]|nr:hypothetical protein [Bacteroidales bacterium]